MRTTHITPSRTAFPRLGFVFIFLALLTKTNAQYSFVDGKVFQAQMDTSAQGYSNGIEVLNTGTANLNFTWEKILADTLFDCEFDLCNSGNCFTMLPAAGTMPTIAPGEKGWLKMHLFSGKTHGLNTIKYLLKGPGTQDTLVYKIRVGPDVTDLKEQPANRGSLLLYPNPAHDQIMLSVQSDGLSFALIRIYDLNGKSVSETSVSKLLPGQNQIPINTSELSAGTYYLLLKSANSLLREKLVIMK
jgi:hypothetical protein